MSIKKVNLDLSSVTMEDIENHKKITDKELERDLNNLLSYSADTNKNSFYGNPTLYHYQLANLLRCRRGTAKTIYELWEDKEEREKLISQTLKKNRSGKTAAGNVWECFRINKGSVVMFKATTAKYLYKKFGATSVLDPTAGWGGRMLGAWALGIDYLGFDTNINMKPAYDAMEQKINSIKPANVKMVYESCLDQDFSSLDYDFVLTSPPYINLEMYEHMDAWDGPESFYRDFFLPLWEECYDNLSSGHVCFNISPKMYDEAIQFGLSPAHAEEDLKQQLGQQKNTNKRQDKIYVWSK